MVVSKLFLIVNLWNVFFCIDMNIRLPELQIVDRAIYIVLDLSLCKLCLDRLNALFYKK